MTDRIPNDEARTDEDGPVIRPLDVDTSTSPSPDDFPDSDVVREHDHQENPHDPDGLSGTPGRDARSDQVGPDNIGNSGINRPG
jgi:hypothetical protein